AEHLVAQADEGVAVRPDVSRAIEADRLLDLPHPFQAAAAERSLAAESDVGVLRVDREPTAVVRDRASAQHPVRGHEIGDRRARLCRPVCLEIADLRIELAVDLHGADLLVAEGDLRVRRRRSEERADGKCCCLPLHESPPPLCCVPLLGTAILGTEQRRKSYASRALPVKFHTRRACSVWASAPCRFRASRPPAAARGRSRPPSRRRSPCRPRPRPWSACPISRARSSPRSTCRAHGAASRCRRRSAAQGRDLRGPPRGWPKESGCSPPS